MLIDDDFFKYIADPAGVTQEECFYVFDVSNSAKTFKSLIDTDITRILSGSVFLGIETDGMGESENSLVTLYFKAKRGQLYALDIVAGKGPDREPNVTMIMYKLKRKVKP